MRNFSVLTENKSYNDLKSISITEAKSKAIKTFCGVD